jgi:hypothetical protein
MSFFSAAFLCFSQCSTEEQSGSQENHNWKSGRNCVRESVHACLEEFELNCLIDCFFKCKLIICKFCLRCSCSFCFIFAFHVFGVTCISFWQFSQLTLLIYFKYLCYLLCISNLTPCVLFCLLTLLLNLV